VSQSRKEIRSAAALPPYYLVYFLLVELLGFKYGGREEKVAWVIPFEFEGRLVTIEHRKGGLILFSNAAPKSALFATRIAKALERGVGAARPFFNHLAAEAVRSSKINVKNNSMWLFNRYKFLRDQSREKAENAEARQNEVITTLLPGKQPGVIGRSHRYPYLELKQEAEWLAVGAIDAFFSWTEHVFIHIGILTGKLKTGEGVANLAGDTWENKAKAALDLSDKTTKRFYEELLEIRRQFRNYIAHGAFGKQGEAFRFHSSAGSVPLTLNDRAGGWPSILDHVAFDETEAISTIEKFIEHLWFGALAPARIYIEEAALPVILTYANDGTYSKAMSSSEEMTAFVGHLSYQMDKAANMEW
jgi:hypothetical protein